GRGTAPNERAGGDSVGALGKSGRDDETPSRERGERRSGEPSASATSTVDPSGTAKGNSGGRTGGEARAGDDDLSTVNESLPPGAATDDHQPGEELVKGDAGGEGNEDG
ncbi:unnamed protein product, partial [Ectocarpus sp. 8 AP-2014]